MYNTTRVSSTKAKKLVEKGALLLDVRNPVSFRNGSLPGAINVSVRNVSSLLKHPKNTKLVFFGDTDTDGTIETVMNYAVQLGFMDVYTFGSIDNWGV